MVDFNAAIAQDEPAGKKMKSISLNSASETEIPRKEARDGGGIHE